MRWTHWILLLAALPCQAQPPPLRFAIVDSWAMPMVRHENGQPTEGILFDVMQSLAQHVGHPAHFQVLPRARVQSAMDHGEVDVRCFVSRSWVGPNADQYLWSEPLIQQRDVLVGTRQRPAPVDLQSLERQSVGTVLSYTYPSLQPLFDAGKLQRDDARSQDQVLQMLIIGRFNYAVSNQWAVDWINKDLQPADQLHAVALVQEQRLGCMVRDDPQLPTGKILNTLSAMRQSGEIERIISRYTAPTPL
ncbi:MULTISPECIES: transporter substrate-binding domain-containing protein [Pseudomonas]|uniref:Amino acid ABC transporter substrate-binding protein n=1 Tax=Pseudomonas lundensis TaxID=86185 RepID=A0A266N6S4_9PSED|nr:MULTISPECIES: transporter substrate-binding domain-containing protein [Pseudomonas]NMY38044.1 amino acid ABC transporter substrate-binding protein [Pseudomonas sp. WS 5078]NMY60578.1 amino acid ABC transporter substrate-binding protein [Pseudomonas sp. WS 5354]NMY74076.1 amino acid ABC transporter substrate-binding protein [Pseudomonas sp. WS 5071]OZY58208.1 amino acid ABC transporter substrate-binding protein [Pseudomonas lundensis]